MPFVDYVIKAPVSVYDVQKALGANNGDIGTLCMGAHYGINPYAYHKPVVVDGAVGKIEMTPYLYSLSTELVYFAAGMPRVWNARAIYHPPHGTIKQPFRLTDFEGYSPIEVPKTIDLSFLNNTVLTLAESEAPQSFEIFYNHVSGVDLLHYLVLFGLGFGLPSDSTTNAWCFGLMIIAQGNDDSLRYYFMSKCPSSSTSIDLDVSYWDQSIFIDMIRYNVFENPVNIYGIAFMEDGYLGRSFTEYSTGINAADSPHYQFGALDCLLLPELPSFRFDSIGRKVTLQFGHIAFIELSLVILDISDINEDTTGPDGSVVLFGNKGVTSDSFSYSRFNLAKNDKEELGLYPKYTTTGINGKKGWVIFREFVDVVEAKSIASNIQINKGNFGIKKYITNMTKNIADAEKTILFSSDEVLTTSYPVTHLTWYVGLAYNILPPSTT